MSEGRRDTFADFVANTRRWADVIVAVRGESSRVELPLEGECDFVFIDGDHSYEAVRGDLARFAPLVRSGGTLLLHDYGEVKPGVPRAVHEFLCGQEWLVKRRVESLLVLTRRATGTSFRR